jgi:hypothetical protein
MADIQVAYRVAQAARTQRNEILGSLTLTPPSSSVPILARLLVESPSVVVGAGGSSMDGTTALASATSLPYPSSGSTGLLKYQTTQLDTPALPVTFQSSSLPMQASAPLQLPSEPVTITFAGAIPVPQEIIHSTSSITGITKSPSQVTTETVFQEVVTISLSASGSDSNSRPTLVSTVLPTPTMNDTGSPSHSTNVGRPAAKAIGNALSYQPTSGTPSSTPTISLPFYPQPDPHFYLNPVAVVGCVLAGILALTVVLFCILRSRRRPRDNKMAIF